MSQLDICLNLSQKQSRQYSVLLDYYDQLSKRQVTRHFFEAVESFWTPLQVWQSEDNVQQQMLALQTGIYRIEQHKKKIVEEGGEIEPNIPHQLPCTARHRGYTWRIQPRRSSSAGVIINYLEKGMITLPSSGDSREIKYWIPNLAWWGVEAAQRVGLDERSVQAMVLYCVALLEEHIQYLEKLCLPQRAAVNVSSVEDPAIHPLDFSKTEEDEDWQSKLAFAADF